LEEFRKQSNASTTPNASKMLAPVEAPVQAPVIKAAPVAAPAQHA